MILKPFTANICLTLFENFTAIIERSSAPQDVVKLHKASDQFEILTASQFLLCLEIVRYINSNGSNTAEEGS